LETKRLYLRILDETYASQVLAFYQNNRQFLEPWEPARNDAFYTLESQRTGLYLDQQALLNGQMVRFWIFSKNTDTTESIPIGTVAITNIIRGVFKSCYIGYKLDQRFCGFGFMAEALEGVVRFAFEALRLHRIEANIMPRNQKSIKVIIKAGFNYEGLSKDYLKINGIWENHYRYAIINHVLDQ
jgi:ribosomal-protein-alanine N-acetyltransferase